MIQSNGATSVREDLLDALYASSSEVPAWQSFVRTAQRLFDCDQAALMLESADEDMPVGTYADEMRPAPIDALFARDVVGAEEGTSYTRSTGDGCALLLAVSNPPHGGATIVLWRSGREAEFEQNERSLLASLADPLRRSLRNYDRVVDLSRRARVSDIALATSRIGVAVLGIDGQLLIANGIMDQILAAGDGLCLSKGQLRTARVEDSKALMAEIRRCALSQSSDDDPQLYTPFAFLRADNALPLTAVVRPGAGFSPLTRPLRRTAILIVRDPAMHALWPAGSLVRLFGLSTAEALLASELAKGLSLDEAANRLGVSRNTLRTQLQSIFLKTGTNRQSDLIRALLNSVATSI